MMTQLKLAFKNGLIAINVGFLAMVTPSTAIAQQQTYPLSTRASFMQGCLVEDNKTAKPPTEDQIKLLPLHDGYAPV
jgi:hypothetical protein